MSILTIQPSNIDTYLAQASPTTNYGTLAYIDVGAAAGGIRRPILKFDFSALPDGAIISAATLSLYLYGLSNQAQGRTYWAYELTQTGWTETGATWNKYDGTNNWTAAGGDYTTDDGASFTMPADGNWADWNVLALCQHFQSTHSKVAHFLLRDGTETGTKTGRFYSRDETTQTTLRPKLVITYTVAYSLTADTGSYAKTGQTATLRAARKIAAAASSYAQTGQAAALRAARKMAAAPDSYLLAGQLAALKAARRMAATPDSYLLTGQPVAFKIGKGMAAGAGSYLLTGFPASFIYPKKVKIVGIDAVSGRLVYLTGNLYET
jgi:hypothetical protein